MISWPESWVKLECVQTDQGTTQICPYLCTVCCAITVPPVQASENARQLDQAVLVQQPAASRNRLPKTVSALLKVCECWEGVWPAWGGVVAAHWGGRHRPAREF